MPSTPTRSTDPGRRISAAGTAPWVGLALTVALVATAVAWPLITGWNVHSRLNPVDEVAPLVAYWSLRVGWGTPFALMIGYAGWRWGLTYAERLGWRALLLTTYVVGAAWALALALVDGKDGLTKELLNHNEYLTTAHRVTDVHATLQEFISRIPAGVPGSWETHVAGHPPGALLFFVGLVRVGLGGGLTAAVTLTLLAATAPVAVLLTLRLLGAEGTARRIAPFLVLAPAAIWVAVSADAMFAAVASWGLAALAAAAVADRRLSMLGWSTGAGLLLGGCVFLSYGLVLLAPLALAVLAAARSWKPLPVAAVGALVVVAAFALAGFRWWVAYPALEDRYLVGISRLRPENYWWWGNLAALALCAGPVVGAGLGAVAGAGRALGRGAERTVAILVGGAVVAVAAADASGMSKAEVERIWLPFVPWLLVSTALLPDRWRRPALGSQIVLALVIQHVVSTQW